MVQPSRRSSLQAISAEAAPSYRGYLENAVRRPTMGGIRTAKARFRIVWVRDSQSGLKTQAAIQKLEKKSAWPILGRSF